MNKVLQLQQIEMTFGDKCVLQKIQLDVEEGEIFGLLGPSGAGKTTMIKIITGQLHQTSGSAILLGTDTMKLTREVYGSVGMVLDNSGLYERLSCYDNLCMFARIYRVSKEKVQEVLEKVGLKDAAKRPVQKLSKGMKQRLVLARAIMHSPKVLFLDEPTSGLDPATARRIHQLIEEERKRGCMVFLTTHNMEEAAKLCDHVALLNEGHIVEYGEPAELCRKYNKKNKIDLLLKDGRSLELQNGPEDADQIHDLLSQGIVESIHSTEPNLETVFISLTGRKLITDECN